MSGRRADQPKRNAGDGARVRGRRSIAETINVIEGDFALSVGDADMAAPRGWRWRKLSDLARLESGHTPSRQFSEYWGGDIPWIGLPDAREHHGRRIRATNQTVTQAGIDNSAARVLPANTVCLSRTASVGYVTVMDRPMATSQDFVNWVCGPELDPDYLMYLFLAESGSLRRFGKGSTHTTIYFPEVQAFRVCLPPIDEQRRIVAKLDALRARSRRAKAALDAVPALLDRLRQSILAAAFRGDLTADWRAQNPDVEPASELRKRIRIERRKRWEEAELAKMVAKGKPPKDDRWKSKYVEPKAPDTIDLPELPSGWCWTTIETVGDLLLGRRRADREYVDGVDGRTLHPYVRVANLKEDRFELNDVLAMPFSPAEVELYRLQPGDIVLAEGQSLDRVGESALYRGGGPDDLCIQATVHRFRASAGVLPEYAHFVFMHYVRSRTFRRAAAITTNIAHLTSERLRPIAFPLAPSSEQQLIAVRVRAALDRAMQLHRLVHDVTATAKSLDAAILAAAFRGELLDSRRTTASPSVVSDDAEHSYPIAEMTRRGWLPQGLSDEQAREHAECFAARALPHAAKKSSYESVTPTQRAWVARVQELASEIRVAPYSSTALQKRLPEIRALAETADGVGRVPGILGECGIRFVVVRPLKSSKIDGVCLWLDEGSPVIGMSLRHDRIDNFWFVLAHELAHVLAGDGRSSPMVDEDLTGEEEPPQEREANRWAQEFLIPTEALDSLVARGRIPTKGNLEQVARANRVHVGIAAGQVRRRLQKWKIFHPHLVAVRAGVIERAVVDGW